MKEQKLKINEAIIYLSLVTIVLVCLIAFAGCVSAPKPEAPKTPAVETKPEALPTPAPVVVEPVAVPLPSLAWDNKPERLEWSASLLKSIDANWQLLKRASDMPFFCANWEALDEATKKEVFAELFVAMAYHESAWSPVSRMQETTMGTDPVTKKPVYSEGLFQLSYQDEQWIKCGFDWAKDKNLDPKSPQKTILTPALNIDCAVRIMARQITSKGEVLLKSGVYWAVIKEGGKYQKISDIKARVKKNVLACK